MGGGSQYFLWGSELPRLGRIGHLGDFNDLTLIGTLGGVEMGLANAQIPFNKGGVEAALDYLANNPIAV